MVCVFDTKFASVPRQGLDVDQTHEFRANLRVSGVAILGLIEVKRHGGLCRKVSVGSSMVFPVYDNLDGKRRPTIAWVTWLLIAANAASTALLLWLPEVFATALNFHLGMVPSFVLHKTSLEGAEFLIPPVLTFLTYGLIHNSWLHLVANMLPLSVFGDDIEADFGHLNFFFFYLFCQLAGAGAHLATHAASEAPLIGSSGAVAGIAAAYLLLNTRSRIVLVVLGLFAVPVRTYWVIGGWATLQLGYYLVYGDTDVSFWCHAGGFMAGAAVTAVSRRRLVAASLRTAVRHIRKNPGQTSSRD
jgi:membrane associated rhomboid family serine protease